MSVKNIFSERVGLERFTKEMSGFPAFLLVFALIKGSFAFLAGLLFITGISGSLYGCKDAYEPNASVSASSQQPKSKLSKETKAELNKLASLGYLGGYKAPDKDAEETAPKESQMAPGLTLYTSGDSPAAYLIDASGNVVHQWSASFESVFPQLSGALHKSVRIYTTYWRNATLLPGGELLIIFEGLGMAKLDKDSKVVWARENRAHHDIHLLPNGEILVIKRVTETHEGKKVFVDYLSFCDKDGVETRDVSLLDALLQSSFKEEAFGGAKMTGDIFHTNSVQVLEAKDASPLAGASAGDVLVSMRNRSLLAVINPGTKKAVWISKGQFKRQHYARLYHHNTLILFDNRGLGKRSQVLIYDWPKMEVRKAITELPGGRRFFSNVMGLATILSNGNYLLVDSLSGRLYEITEAGELVWSFGNPHRTGSKNRLIATIPHAERIALEEVRSWLPSI